jgi:hypothetical protein
MTRYEKLYIMLFGINLIVQTTGLWLNFNKSLQPQILYNSELVRSCVQK